MPDEIIITPSPAVEVTVSPSTTTSTTPSTVSVYTGTPGPTGPAGAPGATGDSNRYTISETAPTTNLISGDLWFKSSTAQLYLYYDSYWIETSTSYIGPNGVGYSGVTSGTPILIGTGTKTFAVASTGAFVIGDRVRVINIATNWVEGTITGLITNTSITVDVDQTSGTGTLSSWTVSIAGIPGTVGQTITGPTGAGYNGVTSSTLISISTGTKTFNVPSTGAYTQGTRVRVSNTGTPANYLEGVISSLLADTSITVNVDTVGGSTGPFSSWTFSVAGNAGATGNGVSSIARTSGNGAAGTTDTFTITYTNGSSTTFNVYNGSNGATGRGVTSIARTSGNGSAGSTDTYTITYSNSTTSTFTVVNGANGTNGTAATIAVGTVTGLAAGATPTVTNAGDSSAARFNFGIPAGATGSPGQGVPTGGSPGQILSKIDSTNYNTQWVDYSSPSNLIKSLNLMSNSSRLLGTGTITDISNSTTSFPTNDVGDLGAGAATSQTPTTIISVGGTADYLVVGMIVSVSSPAATGVFPTNTTVTGVNKIAKTFSVNQAPTTPLSSATLNFLSTITTGNDSPASWDVTVSLDTPILAAEVASAVYSDITGFYLIALGTTPPTIPGASGGSGGSGSGSGSGGSGQ